ncbi:MAG: hypothetical protein H7338_21800 [Candidatus Sericytochromatia bacterium]|nr:hypothetical protein [Candidatus Sericytochromatia bacterium]
MSHAPTWLTAILTRFLTTSTPPCDPVGHYALYAPEALLLVGSHVWEKQRLSATAYVQAWESLLTTMDGMPHATHFTLKQIDHWSADTDGYSVAATVTADTGETLQAAWRVSPEQLILGCCVLPVHQQQSAGLPPADGGLPAPAHLMALCLAELAHWGNHFEHPVWPLTGLAAAYHRHHAVDQLPLRSLPESRFTCQNRGDCCRMGTWSIQVDGNTASALSRVDWSGIGVTGPGFEPVRPDPSGQPTGDQQLRNNADGDCLAHSGNGCAVHATMGWQPIHTCQIFPYQFIVTPDSIAVTASFLCLTVGDNVGAPLQAQMEALQGRLQPIRHRLTVIPSAIPLWPDGPTVPWPTYQILETWLLDRLADRGVGDLPHRVRTIGNGLTALLDQCRESGTFPTATWRDILSAGASTDRPATPIQAEALMGLICDGSVWDEAARRPLNGWQADAWHLSATVPCHDRRDDELATRYLRTVLFRKLGLGSHGVAFTWGVVAWLACLWDRQTVYRSLVTGEPVDRTLQLDTARKLDHSLLHTPLLAALAERPDILAALCDTDTWASLSAVAG